MPGKNDHEFFVTFIASERLTRKVESEVEKYLKDKVGALFAEAAKKALFNIVTQKGIFGSPV